MAALDDQMRKCLEAVDLIFARNFAFQSQTPHRGASAPAARPRLHAPGASHPRGAPLLNRPVAASVHDTRQRELRRDYDEEQAVLLAKVRAERRFQERLALLHARHRSRQLSGSATNNGHATKIAPEELQALCQRVFHFDSKPGIHTFATLQALQGKQLELEPATAHVRAILREKNHPLTLMLLEGRRKIVREHYSNTVGQEASMFDAGSDAREFLLAVRQLVIDIQARMCDAYPDLLEPGSAEQNTRSSGTPDSAEKRQTSLFTAVRVKAGGALSCFVPFPPSYLPHAARPPCRFLLFSGKSATRSPTPPQPSPGLSHHRSPRTSLRTGGMQFCR